MKRLTVLPVVERELRVASRRLRTHRGRALMALIALGFTAFNLWAVTLVGLTPMNSPILFECLVWIAYVYCLMVGAASTLESLSEEKREGTLGLLFLTNLRGRDVVLGKFAACALGPVFDLVAAFPVLAIPMLLGGATLADFGRAVLALLTTLFFMLATGLLISASTRQAGRIVALVVLLSGLYGFGLSRISEGVRLNCPWPEIADYIDLFNTHYLIRMALPANTALFTNHFWAAWFALSALSVFFLCWAAWMVPRTWQEKPLRKQRQRWTERFRQWRYGSGEARAALRLQMLEWNPAYWLAARERYGALGYMLWFLAVGLIAAVASHWNFGLPPNPAGGIANIGFVWFFAGCLMHLIILAGLASMATRRLGEDRRSGALELLVSTPLGVHRLLEGEWRGIVRRLAGPMIGALLINVFVLYWFYTVISLFEAPRNQSFTEMVWEGVQRMVTGPPGLQTELIMGTYIVTHLLLIPAAWYAIGWTGMWLAMRVRKPLYAPLSALGLVVLLPFLIWLPVESTFDFLRFKFRWNIPETNRFSVLLFMGICLANSFLLAQWSRQQLRQNFRLWAANRYSPPVGEAGLRWLRRKPRKSRKAGQLSPQAL